MDLCGQGSLQTRILTGENMRIWKKLRNKARKVDSLFWCFLLYSSAKFSYFPFGLICWFWSQTSV